MLDISTAMWYNRGRRGSADFWHQITNTTTFQLFLTEFRKDCKQHEKTVYCSDRRGVRCRSSRLFIRRERLTGELQQDTFVFRLDIFAHTINSIQIIVRFSADCLIYIVTHFARFVKYFQEHFTFQPHFIFIQTTSSSKTRIYTKIPS